VTKIGIFVGSLRKKSFSEQIAKNVAEWFPAGYSTEFIQIDNLPFYNEDYDNERSKNRKECSFSLRLGSMNRFMKIFASDRSTEAHHLLAIHRRAAICFYPRYTRPDQAVFETGSCR